MLKLGGVAPSQRKRNPWAIVVWCVEHPFWPIFVGLGLLSIPFVVLGIIVADGFILVSFIAWFLMGLMLFCGAFWVTLDFFYEGGWDKAKRSARERYENHGRIED